MGGKVTKIRGKPVKLKKDFSASIVTDSEYGNFETRETIDELSREKNYGILFPEPVFRNIMIYLPPTDYLSVILTCRLVHKIGSTPIFWRDYYHAFYKVTKNQSEMPINFKKQFFKRYYFKSEYFYTRKKYFPIQLRREDLQNSEPSEYNIVIIGDEGIGKREYASSLGFEKANDYYINGGAAVGEFGFLYFADIEKKELCQLRVIILDTHRIPKEMDWVNKGVMVCFSISNRETLENLNKVLSQNKLFKSAASRNFIAPIYIGFLDSHEKRVVQSEEIKTHIQFNNQTKKGKYHAYIEIEKHQGRFENGILAVCVTLESIQKIKSSAEYLYKGLRNLDLLLHEETMYYPILPHVLIKLIDETIRSNKTFEHLSVSEEEKQEIFDRVGGIVVDSSLFHISYSQITLISVLGEGGSDSMWYCCEYKNERLAFECFRSKNVCQSRKNYESFENEVLLLQRCVHPRIVKYVGCTMTDIRIGVLYGFCENLDLFDFLQNERADDRERSRVKRKEKISDYEKMKMCLQILEGLIHLHSLNVVHPDLRLKSILVEANGDIRITNFQRKISLKKFLEKNYNPPELTKMEDMDEKCNVFSFSFLMYRMFTENFHPSEFKASVQKIRNDPEYRPNLQELVGDTTDLDWMVDILHRNWGHDREKRMDFEELLGELKQKVLTN